MIPNTTNTLVPGIIPNDDLAAGIGIIVLG